MTISLARDLEMSSAICCGVVSNDFAICVLPSGNVTVMSSRGLPKVSHLTAQPRGHGNVLAISAWYFAQCSSKILMRWSMKSGRGTNYRLAQGCEKEGNIPHCCVCPSSCLFSAWPRVYHLRRVKTI